MEFIKNIIYNILSLQEQFLTKKLAKTINAKNISKKKRHYINGCTMDLSSLADEEKKLFEEKLTTIITSNKLNPIAILKYIQSEGTDVFRLKNAKKILNTINEKEGFIYPCTGIKALYLSLTIWKKFSLKTKEAFILSDTDINKYYFLYNLYNWFAFKSNMTCINKEARDLLNKYLFETNNTENLQLTDIYKLKDAIQQDKSAIEFVIKLCRNYEGTKQALQKIQATGSANL